MTKLHKFKRAWWRTPVTVRKPLIFMLGFTIVAAGIAMLVLPGPGWAAIFLGFAVLASEFAFAERVRDWLVSKLKAIIAKLESWWNNIRSNHKRK